MRLFTPHKFFPDNIHSCTHQATYSLNEININTICVEYRLINFILIFAHIKEIPYSMHKSPADSYLPRGYSHGTLFPT